MLHGLSLETVAGLRSLTQTPEWQCYLEALQARYSQVAAGLTECKDYAEYRFLVGGLKAYEDVFMLPELVLIKQETLRDHTESRNASASNAAGDRRAGRLNSRWYTPAGVESPGQPS